MTIDTSREAVERLLDGVTPGPWEYIIGHSDWGLPRSNAVVPVGMSEFDFDAMIAEVHSTTPYCAGSSRKDRERSATADANARFIAAARDLVPALLAERDAALAEVARLSAPPDALALVAAAYRDAANIVTRAGHSLDAEILARTPADAQAALTAIERAAYERGKAEADALWGRNSRETFEAMCAMRDAINEHVPMPSLESDLLKGPEASVFCATVAEAVVKALLTQEGR